MQAFTSKKTFTKNDRSNQLSICTADPHTFSDYYKILSIDQIVSNLSGLFRIKRVSILLSSSSYSSSLVPIVASRDCSQHRHLRTSRRRPAPPPPPSIAEPRSLTRQRCLHPAGTVVEVSPLKVKKQRERSIVSEGRKTIFVNLDQLHWFNFLHGLVTIYI